MKSSRLFEGLQPGQLPAQVDKKIIYAGKPGFPEYKDGTKITFHFETRVSGTDDKVIDNTKTMGKPMELLLGKQFKLEIWEAMLRTMAIGEVAKFTVPKLFVMNYPMVSKALRDSIEGKRDHHCCGMLSQGCGYSDLDELMKTPKDLEFIFEIQDVKTLGEYERETWQLTGDELLESVPVLREEGNKLFKINDVPGATKKYFEAIARIEQLALKEKPGGEESKHLDSLKVPLLLNYSLCLMKADNYYEAIQHLTTAIEIDGGKSPNHTMGSLQIICQGMAEAYCGGEFIEVIMYFTENVKGLFRRGQCHAHVGNLEEAQRDYEKALKLDPTLKTRVSGEIKKLKQFEKKQEQNDKVTFQKMFTT